MFLFQLIVNVVQNSTWVILYPYDLLVLRNCTILQTNLYHKEKKFTAKRILYIIYTSTKKLDYIT